MRMLLVAALLALIGCTYEGKFDHPLDCAMGLTLYPGYCPRPGTPGYEREQVMHPPPLVWSRAGASGQDFAKDRYACMQESRSNVAGASGMGSFQLSNGTILPGSSSAYSRETINGPLFSACMEARGYMHN